MQTCTAFLIDCSKRCCKQTHPFVSYISSTNISCYYLHILLRWSQWPRGLRRGSAAAGMLGFLVRIPRGECLSVCCESCVLSGRGLYDGPIPRQEESYRLWCVVVCDLDSSRIKTPWPGFCRNAIKDCMWCIEKYRVIIAHVILHTLIHSSICVLSVTLSACRPKYAQVDRTT